MRLFSSPLVEVLKNSFRNLFSCFLKFPNVSSGLYVIEKLKKWKHLEV